MASKTTTVEPLLKAISFAARKHEGQRRKDGRTPYAAHPMRVATIAMREFGVTDVEVLTAAVLHDTIEDTTADFDDLAAAWGPRVAGWVTALTKDKRLGEARREAEYFDGLEAAPVEVKLCKLADTLDNLIDAESLPPAGRAKAVKKAREILRRFGRGWPARWQGALDVVEARVRGMSGRAR
ncbi:MAG: bifunctional (p)ppGpp synthetase/guanosine-3',5'-bis(diphosphate) 3'-pyrophosphohydrolase, partial [Candidatus Brocadiae bacterium]|nr:bifunctional (p)ppGpp synthetase/guanosine-3',5'-bis(diphosphate) 3'-pyrophosphohydrolase [Candidatus Brocadiia bacterium]